MIDLKNGTRAAISTVVLLLLAGAGILGVNYSKRQGLFSSTALYDVALLADDTRFKVLIARYDSGLKRDAVRDGVRKQCQEIFSSHNDLEGCAVLVSRWDSGLENVIYRADIRTVYQKMAEYWTNETGLINAIYIYEPKGTSFGNRYRQDDIFVVDCRTFFISEENGAICKGSDQDELTPNLKSAKASNGSPAAEATLEVDSK